MSEPTDQQLELLKAAIEDGLPITPNPFETIAQQSGLTEQQIVEQLTLWVDEGFIKRMGLIVRHHSLGYRANAMVVWDVPDDQVDRIGEQLRQHECVTLCYRRKRQLPDWPYNLYCMIHGKSRERVLAQIQQLVEQENLNIYSQSVLFSQQQFKQTGGHYARRAG